MRLPLVFAFFFEDVFGRDEWPLLDVFVLKR